MAIKHSLGLKNYALANGIKGAFDADMRINFYTGSPPADADAAATGTLLGTVAGSATAFGSATGGAITAAAISNDTSADASGTAGWFRMYKAADDPSGATGNSGAVTTHRRIDGVCGQGSGDISFDNAAIVAGGVIAVSALTLTHPA